MVIALGSSGPQHLLKTILSAIEGLPILALVATSHTTFKMKDQENVIFSPFLPLDIALKNSDLAITNGGSPLGYSCLANGVPFIGVASNMDQITFTTAVELKGAARLIRSRQLNKKRIKSLIISTLNKNSYRDNAKLIQKETLQIVASKSFPKIIKNILAEKNFASQNIVIKRLPKLIRHRVANL